MNNLTGVTIKNTKNTTKRRDEITTLVIVVSALFYPLLAFPVSLYVIYNNKKQWRVCIFAMSLFFASMAYCYTPEWENDLARYWATAQQISGLSFWNAFLQIYRSSESNVYLFNLMAWLAGRTDLHILPAISTYVVYYISFYITCSIGEKSGKDWKHTFGYLVFIMCFLNFYEVTETVRNIMAFSMVEAAVFREIYEEKKDLKTLALYVFPIFIHPTALLLIAIRLVFNFTSKMKIILLFLLAFINPIINWIYDNFFKITNISIVNTIIRKAYTYLIDNTNSWGVFIKDSIYYNTRRIVYICFAILTCIYFFLNAYMSRKNPYGETVSIKTKKLQNYVFIIILLSLGCMNSLTHDYWRFVSALVIFGGVYYIPFAEEIVYKKISLLIAVFLCIFCAFGVLISFYFFTLYDNFHGIKAIVSSMLFTCPIYVLLKDFLILIGFF